MASTTPTQNQNPSPKPQTPSSPGFLGAGSNVWGLIEIDVDELADRLDIYKAIVKYVKDREKFRVLLAYDVSDDIFQLKPKQMPLSEDELEQKLNALNIKYDRETGSITEVPDPLTVVRIYDGFGSTYIVLRKRKER